MSSDDDRLRFESLRKLCSTYLSLSVTGLTRSTLHAVYVPDTRARAFDSSVQALAEAVPVSPLPATTGFGGGVLRNARINKTMPAISNQRDDLLYAMQ